MAKLSDYFNSTTNTGRANVAKATYAAIALAFIYARFIRKKTPKKPTSPQPTTIPPSTDLPKHDAEPIAPKQESTCPKCQCGCQCHLTHEADPSSDKSDDHSKSSTNDSKTVHESHPAQQVHMHNVNNDENTKHSVTITTTPTLFKDIDIQEVLANEKFKSFNDFDFW